MNLTFHLRLACGEALCSKSKKNTVLQKEYSFPLISGTNQKLLFPPLSLAIAYTLLITGVCPFLRRNRRVWNPNMHIKHLGFLGPLGEKYPCMKSPSTDYFLLCSPNTDTSAPGLQHWAETMPTFIWWHKTLHTAGQTSTIWEPRVKCWRGIKNWTFFKGDSTMFWCISRIGYLF